MGKVTADDRRLAYEILRGCYHNEADAAHQIAHHRLAVEARGRVEGARLMQEAAAKTAT